MEHLTLKDGFKPIEFPVYSNYGYVRGDFATAPEQNGWTFKLGFTAEQALEGRTMTEIASFLQAWLFFGFINVFFGPASRHSRADFVRLNDCGEHVLTTSKLGSVIQDWDDEVDLLGGTHRKLYLDARVYLCMVVRSKLQALNSIFGIGDREASDTVTLEASKFVLPLQILHLTLVRVLCVSHKWFECLAPTHNPYLVSLLLEQGWCKHVVWNPSGPYLGLHEQCYVLSLNGPHNLKNHALCSTSICKTNQVESTESYEMKHVTEGCQCVAVSPCQRDITMALESGLIPLVCIQKRSGKYRLEVVTPKSLLGIDYIAISHVWAEGLGASKQSSLYQCQVERLDRALQDLSRKKNPGRVEEVPSRLEGVPIWMDTFCIPVEEEYSELRKLSIMKMREIYKEASSVLVVDAEIRHLSKQVSRIELIYRFILSGWEQRLWTFQEGYLARNISFLVLDGAISSSLMLTSSSDEPVRLSVFSTATRRMKDRFLKVPKVSLNRPISSQSHFLEVVDVPNTIIDILNILILLNNRTTSKREDETIVLANILGIPSGPLQQTVDPEARMVLFLQSVDKLFGTPLALLFCFCPRLSEPGFRWAPTSFISPIANTDLVSDGLAQLSETGTHLTFEHPSIEIAGQPEPHGFGFVLNMQVEHNSGAELIAARYALESYSSIWNNDVHTDRKMVVLQAGSLPCRGVLMEVIEEDADGRLSARYCCCLNMQMVNPESCSSELRELLVDMTFNGEKKPSRRWIVE